MAVERIIDLENQRYADREYEGRLPVSAAPEEAAHAERQHAALARLRTRVHEAAWKPRAVLDRSDLADLLIVMGADE